jgi:hypothetical protein
MIAKYQSPRASGTAQPMPETVPPGIVLVDIYDLAVDDFGRQHFFAYWADDIRWRGGGLVAGQVFHTDLREFAAREAERGFEVDVMWP